MLGEPGLHLGRLVRPVVVEHEVDVEVLLHAPVDPLQEADELFRTMARLALADDDAALQIERSKQRRRAMALVVVRHRSGPALLQGQARLGAVERLDLALLVDAQYQGSVWRVHVEPDDVGHFLLELRVVRDLEPLDEMRLEASLGPDAPHARRADAHRCRHRSPAPVRRVGRRLTRRLRKHLELDLLRQGLLAAGTRLVAKKPVDAILDVTLLPAPHARLRLARAPHDLIGAVAIGCREHDPRAPRRLARAVAIRNDRLELRPTRQAHVNADVVSPHGRTLTDLRPLGNHVRQVVPPPLIPEATFAAAACAPARHCGLLD